MTGSPLFTLAADDGGIVATTKREKLAREQLMDRMARLTPAAVAIDDHGSIATIRRLKQQHEERMANVMGSPLSVQVAQLERAARQIASSFKMMGVAENFKQLSSANLQVVSALADQFKPTGESLQVVRRQLDQILADIRASLAGSGILSQIDLLKQQGQELRTILNSVSRNIPAELIVNASLRGLSEAGAVPRFPVFDPGVFGLEWDDRWAAAGNRLRARAEELSTDPEVTVTDIETFVGEATSLAQSAPEQARAWIGEFNRSLLVTLLITLILRAADPILPSFLREEPAKFVVVLIALSNNPSPWPSETLPNVIQRAGPGAIERTREFFAFEVQSHNTRQAYFHATAQFFYWCNERGLDLEEITPTAIAAYARELDKKYAESTVKQHLAAIRRLFEYLAEGGLLPTNPAAEVHRPRRVVRKSQSQPLSHQQVRDLLESIDISSIAGLRDRALVATLLNSSISLSALLDLSVEDYRAGVRCIHGEGEEADLGSFPESVCAYINEYLDAAGIARDGSMPLFRSLDRSRQLTDRPLDRNAAWYLVKRRAKAAGLPAYVTCRTLQATDLRQLPSYDDCFQVSSGQQ